MKQALTSPDSAKQNLSTWKNLLPEPHFQMRRLRAERAGRSLKQFVIQAWPILEPETDFVDGFHIRCDLFSFASGQRGSHREPHYQGSAGPCKIPADRGLLAGVALERPSGVALAVQRALATFR